MTLNHPHPEHYVPLLEQGLAEDIGRGDITSQIFIDANAEASCRIVAREAAILCGVVMAETCFYLLDDTLEVALHATDGESVSAGNVVLSISGNARSILAAERTALNLLSYLSGIASYTHRCVEAVAGTGTTILDTRKTLPGYRELAKYAVRCGGGQNHRMRLDDGVMVKDNHSAMIGNVTDAVAAARVQVPALTKIEVECDTLEQVQAALTSDADVLMLDNMSVQQVREAVALVDGRKKLEASGGMTLDTLRDYAEAGVDYISLGALTHSVTAADFGLDWDE